MSKYTPGPWEARGLSVFLPNETALAVATCVPHRPEAQANARLIAAAPELLEALQAVQIHLEHCGWGDSFNRERAEDAGLPNMITAAIAKATGAPHVTDTPETIAARKALMEARAAFEAARTTFGATGRAATAAQAATVAARRRLRDLLNAKKEPTND